MVFGTSDSPNISVNFPTWCPITKHECPSRYLVFAFTAPPVNKPHRVNQDQIPRRISAKVTGWARVQVTEQTWAAQTVQYPCPKSIYRQGRGTSEEPNISLTQRKVRIRAFMHFRDMAFKKKNKRQEKSECRWLTIRTELWCNSQITFIRPCSKKCYHQLQDDQWQTETKLSQNERLR